MKPKCKKCRKGKVVYANLCLSCYNKTNPDDIMCGDKK